MNKIFYLYDLIENRCLYKAQGFEELFAYIANKYNQIEWYNNNRITNDFLDDYNCTLKDTTFWGFGGLRRYVCFDEEKRIIDLRKYKKQIFNMPEGILKKYIHHSNQWYKEEREKPYFRNGPIPRTGRDRRWGSHDCWRHPKTMNEIRNLTNPEYIEFSRKRRINTAAAWRPESRMDVKSWKDQSKKRKQWM